MLGQLLMAHRAKINVAPAYRSGDQWKTPSWIDDFIAVDDGESRDNLLD
jgi:hypothetical protein